MANSKKSLSIDKPVASADDIARVVAGCIERHVLPGQGIVVGLSGGIDSVALLHILVQLRKEGQPDFQLSALHVHHGISLFADEWDDFCHDACKQMDVAYSCLRVAVERSSKDGLEAAARRARHEVFAAADADWLMLAHQRDDQAETLLFNLLRGSGIAGVAAMRELNGRLLRPMLTISRGEIEQYAQLHQLDWCEDESNADTRYSRNFLRRSIIPALTLRFPATTKNLAAAAGRFAEAHDMLNELAIADLGDVPAEFPLSLQKLRALSEARARNLLRYLLAGQNVQIPSEARLREALRQMLAADADRHPALVFGRYRLLRRRGWIYLEPVAACADKH